MIGAGVSRLGAPHLGAFGASGRRGSIDTTTFLALAGDSGPAANMPSTLLVNGTTLAPFLRYEGASFAAASWPAVVGPTLAQSGSGTDVAAATTPYTAGDASAVFNGKFLSASQGASAGLDFGTDDGVIVLVSFPPTGGTGRIGKTAAPLQPGSGFPGWALMLYSNVVGLALSDGTNFVSANASVSPLAWTVSVLCFDKSEATAANSCRMYSNGALANTLAVNTVGTIDAAAGFDMGPSLVGGRVAFLAAYKAANLFPGGASNVAMMDALAKEIAARIEGTYAQYGLGTRTPATRTRSSAALVDVIDTATSVRTLHSVGSNHMRICRRKEVAGGEFMTGMYSEAQSTNLLVRSEEIDNASWAKAACTVTANTRATVLADGVLAADSIIADGTNAAHGVTQAPTLTATGHILSWFVEAGNRAWVYLSNATIANGLAWFNVATGVVGTKQAGVIEHGIEPWGAGRFRIWIRFTGTAAAHTLGLFAASADNTTTFTGDAVTTSIYAFGAQVEAAPQDTLPSSYIATTTASVTRTVDNLAYKTDDGNYVVGSGQLSVDIMYPLSRTPTNVHAVALIAASTAASGDYHDIRVLTSTGFAFAREAIAGTSEYAITGTASVVDGERHTLTSSWDTNAGKLLVDGTQQSATDTSVTTLAAAPALFTLGNVTSSAYANALIGNVRLRRAAA